MGTDTSLAVLSDRPRLLYDYFKQVFAQVTNPPLDAIREELVTSMESTIGPEGNLLDPRPESCRQIAIKYPVIDNDQLAKLRHVYDPGFRADPLPMLFDPAQDGPGLERAMEDLKRRASDAVEAGYTILILSDRDADRDRAPIPSLLATAGVHHHLVRAGHAHALRAGRRIGRRARGAPLRAAARLRRRRGQPVPGVRDARRHDPPADARRHHARDRRSSNYIKALNKGILKVMSKMGISTLQSYCGAQIFEAVGLDRAFVDKYFTRTASRIGGVGIDVVAEEVRRRHEQRVPDAAGRRARPRLGRRVPVAARRRVPPVQPRHGLQAAARDAQRAVRDLQGVHAARRRPEPAARDAARPARAEARRASRCRSTRSSRSSRSSSASRPARCRTARSARRRTRRSPSR